MIILFLHPQHSFIQILIVLLYFSNFSSSLYRMYSLLMTVWSTQKFQIILINLVVRKCRVSQQLFQDSFTPSILNILRFYQNFFLTEQYIFDESHYPKLGCSVLIMLFSLLCLRWNIFLVVSSNKTFLTESVLIMSDFFSYFPIETRSGDAVSGVSA